MSVWPNGTISKFLCLSQGGGVIGGSPPSGKLYWRLASWVKRIRDVTGLAVLFGFNRHKAHLVRPFLPFLGQLDASQFPPNPPEFPHRMLTLLGEGSIRQFGGRSGAPSLFRISIPLKFGLAPMSER